MSSLIFRGSRKPGFRTICRRHHDLGGTDYEYIASIPDEAAQALENGGTLSVRLREDAQPDQARWRLDVVLDGEVHAGCFLSSGSLGILTAEPDNYIAVVIEGGELTHRKYSLLVAREELVKAETKVRAAQELVQGLEQQIREMTLEQEHVDAPDEIAP